MRTKTQCWAKWSKKVTTKHELSPKDDARSSTRDLLSVEGDARTNTKCCCIVDHSDRHFPTLHQKNGKMTKQKKQKKKKKKKKAHGLTTTMIGSLDERIYNHHANISHHNDNRPLAHMSLLLNRLHMYLVVCLDE